MAEGSGAQRKVPKAKAMATYLRSAIGRASERLVPAGSGIAVKNEEEQPEDTQWEEKENDMETLCEREQVKYADQEEIHAVDESENERYEVHLTKTPSVTTSESSDECVAHEEVPSARTSHWTYCDVLLQPDDHGLGVNLTMQQRSRGTSRSSPTPKTAAVVKVSSFRRVHPSDIGPAEASGQIHIGDVLHMMDGVRVQSLEDVVAVLKRQREPDAYILLRLLRRTVASPDEKINERQRLEDCAEGREPEGDFSLQPAMRTLVRELVRKNQILEEEIISSRLKQDEQRIQLEQLHALYAKTQLENWSSSFSLPKPLIRPAFASVRRSTGLTSGDPVQDRSSGLSSRLIGSTSTPSYDIEFAVSAERERLLGQFEQQLDAERRCLESKYEAELREIKEVSTKKIRMLEFAVKQLLSQCNTDCDLLVERTASAHVQALRHQLLHQSKDDGCLLCLLSEQFEEYEVEKAATGDLRTHIRSVLAEYSTRKKNFEKFVQETKWPDSSVEKEYVRGPDEDVAV